MSTMKERSIQRLLVAEADRIINTTLEDYCKARFKSKAYFDYIKQMLDSKVLVIPNPQLWIEDTYLTNSTTFSMMQVAKEPYTFIQQPCDYSIPAEEKNFAKNVMASVTDAVYFDRYLAECTSLLFKLNSYYPTHTVEVHDFSLALYTLWRRATMVLLKKTANHYKRFFTHKLLNQFITSLTCEKDGFNPNIKLIAYDSIGMIVQSALWKRWGYKTRFNPDPKFAVIYTHEEFQDFMFDFISPMRSSKALQKDFKYWDIDFREVTHFDNVTYKRINGLMLAQTTSMHYKFWDALKLTIDQKSVDDVISIIEGEVQHTIPEKLRKCTEKYMMADIHYEYPWLEKNIKAMERKGITFSKYEFTYNLLPPPTVFSEVIIDMDEFRKQFPSATEQQFTDIFLMAQAINACRRTFVKRYKRDKWSLCVRVDKGKQPFEFTDLMEKLNTELCSNEMENYIGRIY